MVESKFSLANILNILILLIVNGVFYSEGAVTKQPLYVQKCHEYQNAVFQSGDTSNEKCNFNKTETTDKDTDVNLIEFPHLALVGSTVYRRFISLTEDIFFICVGALISDRFVLVAAHCTTHPSPLTKIRVGGNSDSDKNKEDINIEQIIVHPNFDKIKMSSDIALIKLEKSIKIDKFKRPACLPSVPYWPQSYAFETYMNDKDSQVIEKLKVEKNSEDECTKFYQKFASPIFAVPISYDSQICAGSKNRNSFQRGGGPLQIYHPNEFCMYEIVGLASFGFPSYDISPGDVYTRINSYIDWIESIVWA